MDGPRALRWHPGILAHLSRHGVTLREVEEVIRTSYSGRLLIIGPTLAGRMLTIVLEPESGNTYLPVTARPASRDERMLYRQRREEGGQ